jgi:putative FmdB family regulatory protein
VAVQSERSSLDKEFNMPVYEYTCLACKKNFSETTPVADYGKKVVRCPKCKSRKVERRWSRVSVETSRKS